MAGEGTEDTLLPTLLLLLAEAGALLLGDCVDVGLTSAGLSVMLK